MLSAIMKSFGRHEDLPQAPKTTIVLVLMISLLKPFSASATHFDNTSFNFPSFGSESLKLLDIQGHASVLSPYIYLSQRQPDKTPSGECGQATYFRKMHLWDKATGKAADFAAQFTFSINSQNSNNSGDGLAFFVAPWGSSMSCDMGGAYLGLPKGSFVAIEVDTFKNPWDGDVPHVGIDISNIRSAANVTVPWLTNKTMNGGLVNALITYDSATRNLSVVLMDADGNSSKSVSLHYAPLNMSEYLPEWVDVGFSAATGDAYEDHVVESWNFSSSLRLRAEKTTFSWWKWMLCSVGVLVVMIASLVAWVRNRSKVARQFPSQKEVYLTRASKTTEGNVAENERGEEQGHSVVELTAEFEKLSGPTKFSYEELLITTDSFADARILGRGGFGLVYKGYMGAASKPVAVKVINSDSHQGIKEYISEVKSLSQLRHRNLVQLIGYCHEANTFILVYEFIGGGSLDDHLFRGGPSLAWERRYKVALGLASALHYLHKQCHRCVIHRDIKSSNVILDEEFVAKLADFGLAKLVDHRNREPSITLVKGTLGYLDPEYHRTGRANKESDIYSFGVVLLEIVCGIRATDRELAEEGISLAHWVWKRCGYESRFGRWLWNFRLPVDERLGKDFDKKQAEALMIVGLWCAHPIPKFRPSIEEAMAMLNLTAEPRKLPPKMPSFTYH